MTKFCPNCGAEIKEGNKFCAGCGMNVDNNTTTTNNSTTQNYQKIANRDIVMAVILSIITCGIYGIYWFIVMTDDANVISDEQNASGGLAFLYTLLTCGIYGIYWNYKMGQKLFAAGQKYNKQINDNSILYLILSIFGFAIINYCLIQNDLNKFSE